MQLSEFNRLYRYKTDMAKFGRREVWEVLKPPYEGDCESYVLTLKAKVDGFSKMKLYFCRVHGQGHCVGKVNGMWIDCITKKLVPAFPDSYTGLKKYFFLTVWIKRLKAKLIVMFT